MVKVNAGGVSVLVHRDIAPIVGVLLDETAAGGYELISGWCWGYANRSIAGTRTASNHSWGLAVDLNAPKNPYGPKLVTDMPAWMVDLWRSRGFRWGGDYTGRKDAMHFEFMGTPEAARNVATLITAPSTAPVLPPLPGGTVTTNAPFVAILVHPDGGYIQIGADGGTFDHGGAPNYGSVPGILKPGQTLNAPIVDAAWTPTYRGYILEAADGGIFPFGDAVYEGNALYGGGG